MTLVRYRPFGGMLGTHDDVNRMFDTLLRGTPIGAGKWSPAADVRETEAEFIVRVELPGLDPNEVKINVINNTLVIKGEKKQDSEETKGNWHHVERSYGSFERTFAFPSTVSSDKIRARADKGVLEITVPKADEARPREIRIES